MIRRLKYHEIDFEKYSRCIENSEQRNFYAKKEVLDQLSGNWEVLVDGDYEAVMPIHLKKKFGINFVHMPIFCQQLGIFSLQDDKERNEKFLDFLNKNFKIFLYCFNHQNKFYSILEKKKNYIIEKENYEVLRKRYFKGRKSAVKSAQHLSIRNLKLDAKVIEFIQLNFKGLEKTNDLQHFFQYLKFLNNQKLLSLFGCFRDNELINLAIIISDRHESFLLALVNKPNEIRRNGASFLIDSFLKEHISEKSLNFMGSSIKGVELFFKSFGSKNFEFPMIHNPGKKILKELF